MGVGWTGRRSNTCKVVRSQSNVDFEVISKRHVDGVSKCNHFKSSAIHGDIIGDYIIFEKLRPIYLLVDLINW